MKTIHKHTDAVTAAGLCLLVSISFAGCDLGAEPTMTTTPAEANEVNATVKIDDNAGDEPDIKPAETITSTNTDGYSAGYAFGTELAKLKNQQPGLDLKAAFSGLIDAMSDAMIRLDVTEISAELQALSPPAATDTRPPQIVARTRGFKDDFAALNAMREGVVSLPSGVQYEVLKAGSGEQPAAADAVLVNYQASLTNGTVFDTTYQDGEPMRLPLNEIVVPGLKEALLLMNEGAQWRVVIPPSMGFGRSGNNQLRRRDLIYEIELISIETAQESAP